MIDPLPSDHRHGHLPTQLVPSAIAAGTRGLTTMSSPFYAAHNQIRKRVGFEADTEDPSNYSGLILDEQGTNGGGAPSKFLVRV